MPIKEEHLKEIVDKVLKDYSRSRKDLNFLQWRVWMEIAKKKGQGIYIPFNLMSVLPTAESIARCKRHIMNDENKYNEEILPEPGVSYEPPVMGKGK